MPKQPTTEVDAYIGQRIHAFRNRVKLSQVRFGEMLGVTFQMIQKYEQGQNRLTAARMQQIAEIFKCPIADLYPPPKGNHRHKGKEYSPVDSVLATREGMKLIEAFAAIEDENLRSAVVDLATKFVVYEAKWKREK